VTLLRNIPLHIIVIKLNGVGSLKSLIPRSDHEFSLLIGVIP